MTYAIISDIHANLEALTAVLEDIDGLGIGEIRCLGDVVGYGPNPAEVTDLVMDRCSLTLKGNHDEALVHGAYAFNLRAQKAIEWTRDRLKPGFLSGVVVRRRWEFLAGLPLRSEEGSDLFVHGSPRDPTNEYLLMAEVKFGPRAKYDEVFAAFERRLFVGHSHMPCVITDLYESLTAKELGNTYTIPQSAEGGERKAIINVGSVGQPRDRDPRACYVVVDGDMVTWRRVEYDRERTIAKMASIAQLDRALGMRLLQGV